MKAILFIIVLFNFYIGFSQSKLEGYIELTQKIKTNLFLKSSLSLGLSFNTNHGRISLAIQYDYMGNANSDRPFSSPYLLDKHLLGGMINYRILDKEKLYSPTFKMSLTTELFSSYRGQNIYPPDNNLFLIPAPSFIQKKPTFYSAYYYVSTPLEGGLYFVNEFRLFKSFYLNFGIGYSISLIKIGYKRWGINEKEPTIDLSNHKSLKYNSFDINRSSALYFEAFLGLNYTFSFKKQPKTVAP